VVYGHNISQKAEIMEILLRGITIAQSVQTLGTLGQIGNYFSFIIQILRGLLLQSIQFRTDVFQQSELFFLRFKQGFNLFFKQ
jgi:hypothetical protein